MTYVDRLMEHGWVLRGRRVASCHLLADTEGELHALAAAIGMQRRWAQKTRRGVPHYDLTASRRADAVAAGAKPIDGQEFLDVYCRLLAEARR